MSYQSLSAGELAADDFFRSWVMHPDPETIRYWENWLAEHPEKKALVEEARQLVGLLHLPGRELSPEDFAGMWEVIDARTRENVVEPGVRPLHRSSSRRLLRAWQQWAAVGAGLLLVAALYAWFRPYGHASFATGYGQTATLTLPDGSQVTLNGNSSLRYARQWDNDQAREVWLSGEGFFSVVHTQNHRRFLVHTSGASNVEVLGTRFNVSARSGGTRVVLTSGKVRLNLNQAGRADTALVMQPGDLVQFRENTPGITKKTVDPAVYSAWRDQQLIFDQTPLREVVAMLEDTYGLQVEVADTTLLSRRISGVFSTERTDLLISGLAKIYGLKISRTDKQVTIHRPALQP